MTAVFAVLSFFATVAVPARAGVTDDWQKAVWSGTTGWILMNCTQDASCAVNNYGVDIDTTPVFPAIAGWAWSSNVGWVCFGSSCSGMGLTPEGGAPYARIYPASDDVHGWANIVNLGSSGWVSLNCADLVASCTDYKVTASLSTGVVSGFGWNGNADGSGIGYIDFSTSRILGKEYDCTDGVDNDGDGAIDCADLDCQGFMGPVCVCGKEFDATTCHDSCDNDGDLMTDCADPSTCTGVAANLCPATETACTGGNCCHNGQDDDFDSFFDCADTDCYGVDGCAADEAHIATCGDPISCCSNIIDDDVVNGYDCADPSCSPFCTGICEFGAVPDQKCIFDFQCAVGPMGEAQKCNPTYFPWLETFLDDIYGKGGIQATHAPPASQYNATFCLISTDVGQVVNFTSERCPGAVAREPLSVPTGPSYATALGRIDVAGIEAGKYGQVTHLSGDQVDIPGSGILAGRVWVIDGDLTISNPVTLSALDGQKGSGLVLVRGDLFVNANVEYSAGALSELRSIPSVGWVVLKDSAGTGGRVIVNGPVTQMSGLIFAEVSFDSGAAVGVEQPLTVHGPILSKGFSLQRGYLSPTQGSETVIFDSRTLLNPPPGLADLAKALPSTRSTTPF